MKIKIAVAAALAIFTITVTSIFIANWANNDPGQSSGNQPAGNSSQAALTVEEVARHSSRSDCWVIISNDVYNVTSFIASHPGGVDILAAQCGKEATTAFQTQGGTGGTHSAAARAQLQTLKIGTFGSPNAAPSATPGNTTQPALNLPPVVVDRYPDATLIDSEQEEDELRYRISVDGQCREIRIKDGSIERDREC